jgi:hypothetical protein
MNFRRNRPRNSGLTGARGRSSDWRYPQIEKGNVKRSRPAIRRWLQKAMATFNSEEKESNMS